MTPEQTLDWLAEQHKSQCNEDRPVQKWIRSMKSMLPAPVQPVTWGVDWGKAGDIPCVSIIKRLPGGGIEVVAVEYAPYSYTTPPAAQWQKVECPFCGDSVIATDMPAAQRQWVGMTDEEISSLMRQFPDHLTWEITRAIEAKLKEKNHG